MSDVVNPFVIPEVNGTFNNWCGNCWALEDQGNNIFSQSFNVDTSLHEFKFSADNWSIQENLDSNLSCILINFDPSSPNGWGYANRYLNFNSDTVFPPICWEDCFACIADTWDCDNLGNCFDPGNGLGFFNDSLSCVSDCQVTNIAENINDNFIIYPNPTKGLAFIQNQQSIEMLILYNKLGEKILKIENPNENTVINLSNYATDIYIIEFYSAKHIVRKKIIKI
jgi:hypothetical protein